jgi:hypothetical protein
MTEAERRKQIHQDHEMMNNQKIRELVQREFQRGFELGKLHYLKNKNPT